VIFNPATGKLDLAEALSFAAEGRVRLEQGDVPGRVVLQFP
jgi:hypothetical protein